MIKIPKRSLVVDVSNILFRVAAAMKHRDPMMKSATVDELVGLSMHSSLYSIQKWYKKFKPDYIVFAFEGNNNWRKSHVLNGSTKRDIPYKGNRVRDPEMEHFYKLIDAFRDTIKSHTSINCLHIDQMEADDAIAAYCQLYAQDGHEIYIISGDRDFIQLLKLPGVKLVNPDNGKYRNVPGDKDYEPDIDFWLFLKCIRGDAGDNVPSAYPRVRETKVRAAYDDQFARANLMNETWKDPFGAEHRVGDLFEENKILMALDCQPDELRAHLYSEVDRQSKICATYSHFHLLRFLHKFELNKVRDDASKFMDMFANNQRFLKGQVVYSEEVLPPVITEPTVKTTASTLLSF